MMQQIQALYQRRVNHWPISSLNRCWLVAALVGSQLVSQTGPLTRHAGQLQTQSERRLADRAGHVKAVRRALEEMYAKIAEAQRNKNIEALRATRTPDFTVDLSNGQKWDLDPA